LLELTKTLIEASFAQLIKREFRTSFSLNFPFNEIRPLSKPQRTPDDVLVSGDFVGKYRLFNCERAINLSQL